MITWCENCKNLNRAGCPANVKKECLKDERRRGLEQLQECCDYSPKEESKQMELGIEENDH